MGFFYWLSKFSHEAMLVELFLIACVSASYFGYLLIQKRRYGVAKKMIPDNVVRAFLVELISQADGFKNQLFGEEFRINPSEKLWVTTGLSAPAMVAGVDNGELNSIRAALAASMAKQEELQKLLAQLAKDKAALEAKLAAAPTGAPVAGADPKVVADLNDKIAKLESRLAEYEVIEDDLANLKKYQQENKQLRTQLDALTKGGAAPVAAAPEVAAAPPPPPPPASVAESPVAAAEETRTEKKAEENFEKLVDQVEESLEAPAPSGASVNDPLAATGAQTAPPVTDEPKAPPAPAPETLAAAAGADLNAPPKEKSDADLLNEFERMLSS